MKYREALANALLSIAFKSSWMTQQGSYDVLQLVMLLHFKERNNRLNFPKIWKCLKLKGKKCQQYEAHLSLGCTKHYFVILPQDIDCGHFRHSQAPSTGYICSSIIPFQTIIAFPEESWELVVCGVIRRPHGVTIVRVVLESVSLPRELREV